MTRISPDLAEGLLQALLSRYASTGAPLDVSFREMLGGPSVRNRVTHDLHPYPARLLLNIPSFFLATRFSAPGDLVLDPFCGSGTVLLEAVLAGRNAAGADANPLARLITKSKVTPIPASKIQAGQDYIAIEKLAPAPKTPPAVVNLEYWFHPHVSRDLQRLLESVRRIPDPDTRDLFLVSLSACIKEVSLADPRLSVPVRLRKDQYRKGHWLYAKTTKRLRELRHVDVMKVFSDRLLRNIQKAFLLLQYSDLGSCKPLMSDARQLLPLESESVDLVITSPPYLGAQKYVRSSSLSLNWLGYCAPTALRQLEDLNIGREHYPKSSYDFPATTGINEADCVLAQVRALNPLRAHIGATYLIEMRNALQELARVLKPGSHAVIVVGASTICGLHFPTPNYLVEIAQACGLILRLHVVDSIRTRALMTKRHKSAGKIDSESILVFQK